MSSAGDRALKARVAQEAGRHKDKGTLKEKAKEATPSDSSTPAPAPSGTPAPAPSP
jgi:hypothetical protein